MHYFNALFLSVSSPFNDSFQISIINFLKDDSRHWLCLYLLAKAGKQKEEQKPSAKTLSLQQMHVPCR